MKYIFYIGIILCFSFIFVIYLLKKKILVFLHFFTRFFETSNYFFSYRLFNKKQKIFKHNKLERKPTEKFAIIIQGPLINEDNFTVETIKFYSKLYPEIPVIFSSWKKDIDQIKSEKFKKKINLISNGLPSYSGYKNINLQSVSSKKAILFAKKIGCKYVLKTRSDIRIYSLDFKDYLIDLIKFYKINKSINLKQKERIITTSFTLRYRLYGISDMVMFGNIYDLYNYFNILTTPKEEKKFLNSILRLKFRDQTYFLQNEFCPEIYLFNEFFKKMRIKLKWTVNDSIKKISDNFIIIDNQSLSIYWKKSYKVLNHFSDKPMHSKMSMEFSFNDWLKIFYKSKKIKNL